MVTITIPTAKIKDALTEAVRVLLLELGEDATWKFKDGSADETFRIVRQKLKIEELVGDYDSTNVRITIDATTISKSPAKYDEVVAGDGRTYIVVDANSVDVSIDGTTIVYKPICKG